MGSLLSLISSVVYKLKLWIYRRRIRNLIARGMVVGKNVYIMEGVEFDYNFPYLIEIGDNCRISKGVKILAHDATPFKELGITQLGKVKIGEGAFVGERAFFLPGVTIGPRAMIAANSFVTKDFPEGAMVAGNPARMYGHFDDYLDRMRRWKPGATLIAQAKIDGGKVTPADVIKACSDSDHVFLYGVPADDPFYVNADYDSLRDEAARRFIAFQESPSPKAKAEGSH